MRWVCVLAVGLSACGPKLPPLTGLAGSSEPAVDRVPSQARAELLRARLELHEGDAERALVAARRAANLDQSAAAPWALIAAAECARGDRDAAVSALSEALEREPEVVELRVQRFVLTGDEQELAWLEGRGALTQPWVAVSLSAASELASPAVIDALRARVATNSAGELRAVLAELIRASESPAVVVAALRLHGSGLLPPAMLPDVIAAADDLGVPPDLLLLPQEWRQADSADSGERAVGYSLDRMVAAGWQAARHGRLDEATSQLSVLWQKAPSDHVLRELMWLVQGPSAISEEAVLPAQPIRLDCR